MNKHPQGSSHSSVLRGVENIKFFGVRIQHFEKGKNETEKVLRKEYVNVTSRA